ncbi:MAG: archease, partial [Candidatus Lokiarchaeota archaeon]|nr:archease [Candidatus Lokiarchaeota archaeon]
GEKFDKNKHEIGCEVKAITYSFMEIEEKKNSVKINIVFDI